MFWKWILVVIACVGLSGVPASADSSKPWVLPSSPNWYGYHSGYVSHCNMQANAQGDWGRQRQYDEWCKSNTRYRNTRPDQRWETQHPWDHGQQGDHSQNH